MAYGKRDEWEFEYTARDIAKAAVVKLNYHHERLEWWTGRQAEVMEEIRARGIQVHEGQSRTNTNSGYGPSVTVDTQLQRDLAEATEKITEHKQKVAAYDGWVQTLEANAEARLKLKHDDYLYFFSKPIVLQEA